MFALLIGLLLIVPPGLAAATEDPGSAMIAEPPPSPVPTPSMPADEAIKEGAYQVPVVMNEGVIAYIGYFRTRGRETFQRWLDDSARYLPLMREVFREENLPGELAYVAMIESGFDPGAVSRARAVGPWQFMPDTARFYGLKRDWWVDERKDFVKSTRAAARHFRDLHDHFGSWPLALAAYNGGMGRVQRAVLGTGSDDFWRLKHSRFLHRETKDFVSKFMAAVLIGRNPAQYGFRVPEAVPLRYDEIVVGSGTDLNFIAYLAGSTYERIKALNPELRGIMTPPDQRRYVLKIPPGRKKAYLAKSAAIWKAAVGISREQARLSVFEELGAGRVFLAGLATCSGVTSDVAPVRDSPHTAAYRTLAGNAARALTDRDGKKDGESFFRSCDRRTQMPDALHYLAPRPLSFVSSTTGPRR